MSQFDLDAYFARRNAAVGIQPGSKQESVAEAMDRKVQGLKQYQAKIAANTQSILQEQAAFEGSWAGKLGLEQGSDSAQALNQAASLTSGAARLASNALTAAPDAMGALIQAGVGQDAIDAYNRVQRGEGTEADQLVLDTPRADPLGRTRGTPRQAIEAASTLRRGTQAISEAADISSIVDPTQRAGFSRSLDKEGFNKNWGQVQQAWENKDVVSGAKGIGEILATVGQAAATNKVAALEYMTENAPQIILGVMSGGTTALAQTNVGYAAEVFRKGVEAYAKANNGDLPSQEQTIKMAGQAATLAAAEQVGDVVTAGATKLGRGVRSLTGAAKDAAATVTEQVAERTLKDALKSVAKSPVQVAKATAAGVISEAPTEGYQTYMEGEILGKPASAFDIFEGATIGGISGGGLAGAGRTLSELAGATPEKAAAKAQEAAAAAQREDLVKQATETGDVSAFLDQTGENKANYDPVQAIGALFGNSLKEGATAEQKATNQAKADTILTDLRSKVVESLTKIGELEDQAAQPDVTPEAKKTLDEQAKAEAKVMKAAEKQLKQAETAHRQLTQLEATQTSEQEVAALVEQADAAPAPLPPVDATEDAEVAGAQRQATEAANEASQQAISRVLAMAMSQDDSTSAARVSPEVAQRLADNPNNGLDESQRNYLRAFSKARQAANEAKGRKGVGKEIFLGSSQNLGLVQHRQRILAALGSGNQAKTREAMSLLKGFAMDHLGKAKVAQQALGKSGAARQIVSDGKRGWSINQGPVMSGNELHKNGGLDVVSRTLVGDIVAEAEAIRSLYAEMRAAYEIKYPKAAPTPAQQGTSDVSKPTQQGTGTQAEPQAEAVQDPGADRASDATVGESVPGSAGPGRGQDPEVAADQRTTGASGSSVVNKESTEAQKSSVESTAVQSTEKTVVDAAPSTVEGQGNTQRREPPAEIPQGETSSPPVTETAPEEGVESPNLGQSAEATEQSSGKLEVSAEQAGAEAPFKKKRFADFFKQVERREGDATGRPLVLVKDFLSQLAQAPDLAMQFLKKDTKAQTELLRTFIAAAKAWQPFITQNLAKNDPDFAYTDGMQYLLRPSQDGKGVDVDENVKTAIAFAVFSWVGEAGMRSLYNDPKAINAILGKADDASVDPEAWGLLATVGVRRNLVINTLGQRVVDALGIEALANVPANMLPNLRQSLGGHALKLMLDRGVATENAVPAAKLAPLMSEKAGKTDTAADHFFIQMALDPSSKKNELKPAQIPQRLLDRLKGTQGFLGKLFSVEDGMMAPSSSPVPYTQKKAKDSRGKVPKFLAKVLKRNNAMPFMLRQDMWELLGQIDEDLLLEIAGAESLEGKHVLNQLKIESTNDGLKRELRNFVDFFTGHDAEAPVFFSHVAWKNQRVGIETNLVNPQSSKLHRRMMFRDGWETEVVLADAKSMTDFRLRVAEGLGIKVDKLTTEKALKALDDKFDINAVDPKARSNARAMEGAVTALVGLLKGETLSQGQQETLRDAVKLGGEAMHSLDVLMALAHSRLAQEQGQLSFTSQLMGEIDGVTNGPMFSQLLLGAATSVQEMFQTLTRGGFFHKDSDYTDLNAWRAADRGHQDLYENTSKGMVRVLDSLKSIGLWYGSKSGKKYQVLSAEQVTAAASAIYSFTGQLAIDGWITSAGRKIIKKPLTAMNFGSAIKTAVNGMAGEFIDGLYTAIEEVAAGKRDKVQFLAELNVLLQIGKGPKMPAGISTEQLMTDTFGKAQVEAIRKAFEMTVGEAVRSTMMAEFGGLMATRTEVNNTARAAFQIYERVRQTLREKFIAERIKDGTIEVGKSGAPLHSLTPEQEREIDRQVAAVAPWMHTVMSRMEEDPTAGVFASKSENQLSADPIYKQEVKFGTAIRGSKSKARSMGTTGLSNVELDPGVATNALLTHSFDSGVSHLAQENLAKEMPLNLHDALGVGVGQSKQTAQALNQATWQLMLEFSPAREVYETLAATVRGLAEMVNAGTVPAGLADMTVGQGDQAQSITDALDGALSVMQSVDKMKFEAMAEMGAINQYFLEGGSYEVTDKDRAQARERLAQVQAGHSPETQKALDTLRNVDKANQQTKQEGKQESQQAEELEVDTDPVVIDEVLVSMPAAVSNDLLDTVMADTNLSDEAADLFLEVKRNLLDQGRGASLQRALQAVVKSPAILAQMASHLVKTYQSIDPSLWWGRGKPHMTNHPGLVQFFMEHPRTNVGQVLDHLQQLLQNDASIPSRKFLMVLAQQLKGRVDKNMPVFFVTSARTLPALAVPAGPSRGWYAMSSNGLGTMEDIYILSPEFSSAGLTAETLLHEILHAATFQVMDNERAAKEKNPAYTSPALELIEDLEALRLQAREFALQQGEKTAKKYAAALGSLDEFVTYGMTHLGFQGEILNRMTFKDSKTEGNKLVSGMKSFIQKITGLMFHKADERQQQLLQNGLAVMFRNVSGLLDVGDADKKAARTAALAASTTPMGQTNDYTIQDIHEALDDGSLGAGFQSYLSGLHQSIVEKLFTVTGSFGGGLMSNQALSPIDVWSKSLVTGKAPFALDVVASALPVSPQEAFAMEQVYATVKAGIEGSEARTKFAYKALSDLFTEARKLLEPKDFLAAGQTWAQASAQEKATAQKYYDELFKVEADKSGSGRSDYLARFAALGLTSERVVQALQFSTQRNADRIRDGKTLADKLQRLFEKILEFFQDRVTRTFGGQQADMKLKALVEQLVDIEAKHRYTLAAKMAQVRSPILESAEKVVADARDGMRGMVKKAANASLVRNSSFAAVRTVGNVANAAASGHLEHVMQVLTDLRDKNEQGRYGLIAGLMTEVKGVADQFKLMLLASKDNERIRQRIAKTSAQAVREAFKDDGASLGKGKERKANMGALTAVLVRSGAHALLSSGRAGINSMLELHNLLRDPQQMDREIASLEADLGQVANAAHLPYYVAQARALGWFKATGQVTSEMLLMSPQGIAQMIGMPQSLQVSATQATQAEALLKPLVALYAMKYAKPADKARVVQTLRTEAQRTDGRNGAEFLLLFHGRQEQEAKERVFDNNGLNMVHGYTPEIFNPHIEVVSATVQEGEKLKDLGYVQAERVVPDPADPDQTVRHLYVLKGAGLPPRVSGVISLTGEHAKGSHEHSGYLNPNSQAGAANSAGNALLLQQRQAGLQRMLRTGMNFDPSQVKQHYMAPVFDQKNGNLVNWRYLMREDTKDTLLERDNRFDEILGALAAQTFDKERTTEQNAKAFEALRKQYLADYSKNPSRYMEVGPNSPDRAVQEAWELLPYETRENAKSIWGRDGVVIPKEAFYVIFGSRKLTAGDLFKRANQERETKAALGMSTHIRDLQTLEQGWQKLLVATVEEILYHSARMRGVGHVDAEKYKMRAAVKVMRGEKMWQELVRETKDIIVVKSGVVLLGNIWSNFSLLHLQGVSFKDIVHHHLVALRGAMSYQRDTEELDHLRGLLSTGYTQGQDAEIRREILRLEDAIARNPVTKLVEAGLMPTIVEDLGEDEDIYSYKSQLVSKVEGITGSMPEGLKNAARTAYMAHDTKLYKAMSRSTQLSDFVARYTLYQHLTTRKDNPLSHVEAVLEASDSYVNYDVPMQPGLQYMDDMGTVFFIKYFLRIQRVLAKTFQDAPARVLSLMLLNNLFGLGPIVLDSGFLAHVGNNPFRMGAMQLPGVIDQIVPIAAAMSVVK